MPWSAVRRFADPDAFFASIRNLQIEGLVERRGEFRAESTRIDLHRLWMHRFDEDLQQIMKVTPSGMRAGVLFAPPASRRCSSKVSKRRKIKLRSSGWSGIGTFDPRRPLNGGQCRSHARISPRRATPLSGANWYGLLSPAASPLRRRLCRGCGSFTKRPAISRKQPRTSSQSER